ncbi:heme/hemin ABC transporter substrate-binding protein [Gemmobacter sp.]|uniref:heme/hemin ABC transporter substrate-binding protein n=1 Tax=Gemmobacter sp. TaxID=1898957 RepID=UPI002AFEC25F|nr:ABC transporter substrate-binding protein [Gemmobacter sp.]
MMRALALAALLLPGVALADPAQRIVSIGGSVTEIAVALGATSRLIARDTTSTFPAAIKDLPDVGYIRALSAEGVLALGPDMIISEAGAGPKEAVDVLRAAGVPFVEMPGDPSPAGILAKIDAVARALELPAEGEKLHAEVARGLAEAEARAAAVPGPRKRVLFVLALQSGRVMAGGEGSSAAGIIALAGGVNAAEGFKGYKQMTDEAVIAAAPDVILMMHRDGDLAVHNADVLAHPALAQTPAAQSGALVRMDGLLLLGFGPRTPEGARELHSALYGG